ncbi:Hypothetical Protein FCC1311_089802 [Hondaea fermentalgiana]|uniref:Peptidase S74 domain-containing protein n=1 Tax=Hondaea fermentalgiana TaxID=2315210 RepID=A0A2R5GQ69_9STRA|nr:Hypothetical Protein FCC1311_089802 [Hondaea fermentalgiana]|eukprot:GBG32755.1 Hypothetical Protein FCC1311_089802 [Hondaea fermentalgiana]
MSTVGTRVPRRSTRYLLAALALAVVCTSAYGWCTDDEKGACTFNIRSKAADNEPRSVQFWDAQDKLSAAIEHVPEKHDLRVSLPRADGVAKGKDKQLETRMHLTNEGFLAIGSKDPKHQIDATNTEGTSALRLEGRVQQQGKGAGESSLASAAVRLGDATSHQCANLYFNAQGLFWGLSFSQSTKAIDAADGSAVLQVSSRASPQSMRIDEGGRLSLTQVGAATVSFPRLQLRRARGTSPHVPQIALKDDVAGEMAFEAYDGANWSTLASIAALVHGPVQANQVSGRLEARIKAITKLTLHESAMDLADNVNLTLGQNGHLQLNGGSIDIAKGGSVHISGKQEVLGEAKLHQGLSVLNGDVVLASGNLKMGGVGSVTLEQGGLRLEAGDIVTRGTLRASTALETLGRLSVGGNAALGGDLDVQGTVSAGEGGLRVAGDAVLGADTLNVAAESGSVALQGSLRISPKKGSATSSLEIAAQDGSAFVSFDAKQQAAAVQGSMAVSGAALFGDMVGIEGDVVLGKTSSLNVPGTMAVGSDVSLAGNVVITSPTESTSTETGALVLQGGLGVERSISVGDGIVFGTDGTAAINAVITSEDDSQESTSLEIQGKVVVLDELELHGGLHVDKLLRLDVDGATEFFHDIRANASLAVARDVHTHGEMKVHGNISIGQDALVHGNLSVDAFASLETLHVAGSTTVQGAAQLEGTLNVSGTASILSGRILLGENAVEWNETALQVGDLLTIYPSKDPTSDAGTTVFDSHQGLRFRSQSGELGLEKNVELVDRQSHTRFSLGSGAMSLRSKVENSNQEIAISTVNVTHAEWPAQGVSLVQSEIRGLRALRLANSSLGLWANEHDGALQIGESAIKISDRHAFLNVSVHALSDVVFDGKFVTTAQTIDAASTAEAKDSLLSSFVRVQGKGSVMHLPLEAKSGEWLLVQNAIDEGDLEVVSEQAAAQRTTASSVTFTLAPGVMSLFVHDGEKWSTPNAPAVSGASLTGVRSLTAEADIHVGPDIEFAAGSFRAENLAYMDASSSDKGTNSAHDDASAGTPFRVTVATPNGTLAASSALVLVPADHDASNSCVQTQCVGAMNMSGPIDMNGHHLRNVTIDGGALHGITELHVGMGGMHVSGGIAEASDARLKEDIQSIDGDLALKKVRKLRGISYHAKASHSSRRELGFLAQEVAEVVPEVVIGNDTLAVQYSRMVPLLVESIKRLEERVRSLEAQLAQAKQE